MKYIGLKEHFAHWARFQIPGAKKPIKLSTAPIPRLSKSSKSVASAKSPKKSQSKILEMDFGKTARPTAVTSVPKTCPRWLLPRPQHHGMRNVESHGIKR